MHLTEAVIDPDVPIEPDPRGDFPDETALALNRAIGAAREDSSDHNQYTIPAPENTINECSAISVTQCQQHVPTSGLRQKHSYRNL